MISRQRRRPRRDALGIESDEVANCCLPRDWPDEREVGATVIGDWLKTEARYLV
jgi:hypothetical protein